MKGESQAKALLVLFALVFCWPFVAEVERSGSAVRGVPLVVIYIFAGWGFLVAALAAVSRRMKD